MKGKEVGWGLGSSMWGKGLGQGDGARAWLGGALVKTECIFFISPQKLILIDTQGSLTHIVEIFKFGNVSGPRATK